MASGAGGVVGHARLDAATPGHGPCRAACLAARPGGRHAAYRAAVDEVVYQHGLSVDEHDRLVVDRERADGDDVRERVDEADEAAHLSAVVDRHRLRPGRLRPGRHRCCWAGNATAGRSRCSDRAVGAPPRKGGLLSDTPTCDRQAHDLGLRSSSVNAAGTPGPRDSATEHRVTTGGPAPRPDQPGIAGHAFAACSRRSPRVGAVRVSAGTAVCPARHAGAPCDVGAGHGCT